MSLQLVLVRHGKSDWETGARRDFDRPLAKRGRRDVPRMAHWMMQNDFVPDLILSSPAERARQTALALYESLEGACPRVSFYDPLYPGSADSLRATVSGFAGPYQSCALVGHNPGLDHLLETLAGDQVSYTRKGKLLTTAAVAIVQLEYDQWSDWQSIEPRSGRLLVLMRPRELSQ